MERNSEEKSDKNRVNLGVWQPKIGRSFAIWQFGRTFGFPKDENSAIKPKGGLLVNTLFDFMSGVPFKVFLIASSLITHSIRGILTSVVSFAPFISVVVVQE